eukprot:jgi/Mesvir1/9439/Mv09836-RA.2
MAAVLAQAREIAVDLEHHSYRSFLGFTCLMQVSTREEDWVVDTLALRGVLGKHLKDLFADARVIKVLHGCNSDVVWLQRDFGLFLVNVFDTGQAARVLGLESFALAHLLLTFCGVKANKSFQLADWRVRPLPPKLIEYARDDTHYLLHIYDRLRHMLQEANQRRKGGESMLMEVLRRSRDICLQLYEKPLFTETSYLELYRKSGGRLSDVQLAVFAGLFAWRDAKARAEDEGLQYVLPNHVLFSLAKALPSSLGGVRAVARGGSSGFAVLAAEEILAVITQARRQQLPQPLSSPPRAHGQGVGTSVDAEEEEEGAVGMQGTGGGEECAAQRDIAAGDVDTDEGRQLPRDGGGASVAAASSERAGTATGPKWHTPGGATRVGGGAAAVSPSKVASPALTAGGTAAQPSDSSVAALPVQGESSSNAAAATGGDGPSSATRKGPIVRKATSSLFGGAPHKGPLVSGGPSASLAPRSVASAAALSSVLATARGGGSATDALTSSKLASIHSSFSLPFGPTAAPAAMSIHPRRDAGEGQHELSGASRPPEGELPADDAGSSDASRVQEVGEREAGASSCYAAITAASQGSLAGVRRDAPEWRKLRPPVPKGGPEPSAGASGQAMGNAPPQLSGNNLALDAGARKAMSELYEMPGAKRRRGDGAARANLSAQAAASGPGTLEPHRPADDGAAALQQCGLASDEEDWEEEAGVALRSSGSGSNGAFISKEGAAGADDGPNWIADADGNIGLEGEQTSSRRGAIDYAKRWTSNPAVYEDRLRHGGGKRGRGGGDKAGMPHKALKPVKETGIADGLKPGRRSQAFPVSGNRVGTFTK